MRSDIVYIGSELKLNISIEPIGGYSMEDYDFECEFFCYANRRIVLTKGAMKRQDKDNYMAILDTRNLGVGMLKCKIIARVPDIDCDDNLRTEVLVLETGIPIKGA